MALTQRHLTLKPATVVQVCSASLRIKKMCRTGSNRLLSALLNNFSVQQERLVHVTMPHTRKDQEAVKPVTVVQR
jgi:hypothetical protein